MAEAQKDRSMLLQKEMIASHFARLERAPENHEPVVYTFVPGNLVELIGQIFYWILIRPESSAVAVRVHKHIECRAAMRVVVVFVDRRHFKIFSKKFHEVAP